MSTSTIRYERQDSSSELSPFLIGSTLGENTILDASSMSIYSIDMLRFKLKSNPKEFERIQKVLDIWMTDGKLTCYSNTGRIGGYRFMWAWRYDDLASKRDNAHTSIALGLGHVEGSGKTNAGLGFLEYNPNKLGEQGASLIRYLVGHGVELEPVRYDLAIDFPVARDTVRMVKDGRKYECCISDSMTEYLGQRNKPGRVKVYDKAAESGLSEPLTRVELTTDATWSAGQVLEQLPMVFSYEGDEFGGLKGTTKAFAIAVQALLTTNGDVVEPWLRLVNPRTKTKLRGAFKANKAFEYSQDCVERIVERVGHWVESV